MRNLPAAVEKVLFKALARQPEDRYANMGQLVASLEGLLAAPLLAAQPRQDVVLPALPDTKKPDLPTRPGKTSLLFTKQFGWVFAIAGTAILILLLLATGVLPQAFQPAPTFTLTPTNTLTATASATFTPLPPSATPTKTHTPSPENTPTQTASPTPTATEKLLACGWTEKRSWGVNENRCTCGTTTCFCQTRLRHSLSVPWQDWWNRKPETLDWVKSQVQEYNGSCN